MSLKYSLRVIASKPWSMEKKGDLISLNNYTAESLCTIHWWWKLSVLMYDCMNTIVTTARLQAYAFIINFYNIKK